MFFYSSMGAFDCRLRKEALVIPEKSAFGLCLRLKIHKFTAKTINIHARAELLRTIHYETSRTGIPFSRSRKNINQPYPLYETFEPGGNRRLVNAVSVKAASVMITGQTAGPTPFIAQIQLTANPPTSVKSIKFQIAPKPGSVTRPVNATYPIEYLQKRGYFNSQTGAILLPVFGLYARLTLTPLP